MAEVLIVDDEEDIRRALKIYLSSLHYTLLEAENGKQAVDMLKDHSVDLILMDIMMPQMDGISAMAEIRKTSNVPIILLTAKSEDADKILGLDLGADDYITKPFNPAEVVARVRSQLRRYQRLGGSKQEKDAIQIGTITLNDRNKKVTVDDNPVALTPMEFGILKLLMQNPGKVFSSSEIYQKVSGETPLGAESSIAVHIRHLREKLEINPSEPRYLKVVWGQGYCINDPCDKKEAGKAK